MTRPIILDVCDKPLTRQQRAALKAWETMRSETYKERMALKTWLLILLADLRQVLKSLRRLGDAGKVADAELIEAMAMIDKKINSLKKKRGKR